MLNNLISDLEKYLQISLIKEKNKDDPKKNHYILNLNEGSSIVLEEINQDIYITAKICHFSEKEIVSPEDFYIHLMKANYLGLSTGDGFISISPDEKFMILSLLIDYEINYKMFRDKIEDFVNYLSFWEKEITNKIQLDK